ncbi:MAG: cell division protein [Bacteroidetes bacterium]|nr:MAG: cell division protein [Bacteroidota bacterium]
MPTLVLETFIKAPKDLCFDLSRSIDLHMISTSKSKEKVVAGRQRGLIEKGEFVEWEAKHFGLKMRLRSKISKLDYPNEFLDEMEHGPFKFIYHLHKFTDNPSGTIMIDQFRFETPLGLPGKLVNYLFLTTYMKKLLEERNAVIKNFAETDQWKSLPGFELHINQK